MSGVTPVAARAVHASTGSFRWLCLTDGQLELLKWTAFGSMLVDHFGRYAFGQGTESWSFAIGRLAFPLFAFVLASNLARDGAHGPRAWRTSRRLAVWALVSVIPSWWARDTWLPVNVLATLSIGAALCAALRPGHSAQARVAAGAVGVTAAVFVEFGVPGVLFVVTTYRALVAKSAVAGSLAVAMLALTAGINMIFGGLVAAACTLGSVAVVLGIQFFQPGIARHKWVFYFAYPLHLVAVAVASGFAGP
jgi:hypothetical protein